MADFELTRGSDGYRFLPKTDHARKLIIDEGLRHYINAKGTISTSKSLADFLTENIREAGLSVRRLGKGAA